MRGVESAWPGGAQAAVTLSFDDGYRATYDATVMCLCRRGLAATYHVVTDCIDSRVEGLPTAAWRQWQEASLMGHEIASHGATHAPLAGWWSDVLRLAHNLAASPNRRAYARRLAATCRALGRPRRGAPGGDPRRPTPPPQPSERLSASRQAIDCHIPGAAAESLAYAAGRHDPAARRAAQVAGYRSARTLDWGLNDRRTDRFALRAVGPGPALTEADLDQWLCRAREARGWLIVVLHLVAEANPTAYPYHCSPPDFLRLLDRLQSQPLWIAPQRQVVRYLAGGAGCG